MTDDPEETTKEDDEDQRWTSSAEVDEGAFLTVRSALGRNIRRLRTRRGWSQEALAEAMEAAGFEWSRVTVAQSENEIGASARSRKVTVEELIGLALVLRTTVLELLGPDPIWIGETVQDRDDLISHLVGGPQAFAPEELTLLTRRSVASAEIQRLNRERKDLDEQIAKLRSEQEEDQ